MKIKKIAAICKPWKQVDLITVNEGRYIDSQYIKAGNGIYPVRGLPAINPDQLLTLFDIPENKRDDWTAERCAPDPDRYNLDDMDPNERPVVIIPFGFRWGETDYQPIRTSRGVLLIPVELFGPLELGTGMYELFERENSFREIYLVAKVGMILQGIIFPQDILTENFMETFRAFYRGIETSYEGTIEKNAIRLEQTRKNLEIEEG